MKMAFDVPNLKGSEEVIMSSWQQEVVSPNQEMTRKNVQKISNETIQAIRPLNRLSVWCGQALSLTHCADL